MRTKNQLAAGTVLTGLLCGALYAGDGAKRTWTFDGEPAGAIAKGFTNEVGRWTVVASDWGQALAQSAKNGNSVFNVALAGDTNAKDVDLSVRMKAIAGDYDQGGGLVWRARDVRTTTWPGTTRWRTTTASTRSSMASAPCFQNADIAHTAGWHTLRVTMEGDHVQCYYDGKKYLDAKDATFPEAGKIGLWTKAERAVAVR